MLIKFVLGWNEGDDNIITENKIFFRTQTNDSSPADYDDSANNEPGKELTVFVRA